MRKATLSYSDVYYPDELAFAFKPIMVTAENTGAKTIAKIDVSVTHGAITHTAAYYAHGGKVYANIDAFVQSLFDTSSFGVDYSQTVLSMLCGVLKIMAESRFMLSEMLGGGQRSRLRWGYISGQMVRL